MKKLEKVEEPGQPKSPEAQLAPIPPRIMSPRNEDPAYVLVTAKGRQGFDAEKQFLGILPDNPRSNIVPLIGARRKKTARVLRGGAEEKKVS